LFYKAISLSINPEEIKMGKVKTGLNIVLNAESFRRLENIRENQEMTRGDLGEKVKILIESYEAMLSGLVLPSASLKRRFCKALNVNYRDIWGD
jgi:DNA-binding XRE family transcriptional regulator